MSTDLTIHEPTTVTSLTEQMDYARAVSSAALLPAAYRGKPADILIATGLGNAIGIAPAQALYEIYVVNGRPSPSANLMAALVRRAGHKLRIEGNSESCTATLIRADDPEFPMTATWTIGQAKAAGLTGKDTWKQYPQAMLRARAIAEVVRMGAPEAVMGMEYAREEVEQFHDAPAAPAPKPQGMAALREAVQGEPVEVEPTPEAEPEPDPRYWRKRMFALFSERGIGDADEQRRGISHIVEREISSRSQVTEDDARAVVEHLTRGSQ